MKSQVNFDKKISMTNSLYKKMWGIVCFAMLFISLSSFANGGIFFEDEEFTQAQVHDNYVVGAEGTIIPMDGLENANLKKGYLQFYKTPIGTYGELLGPYDIPTNYTLGYLMIETYIGDKHTKITVKGVRADMTEVFPETTLTDGSNSIPVNLNYKDELDNPNQLYLIFRQTNTKILTKISKIFVLSRVYGLNSDYTHNGIKVPMLSKNQVYATASDRQKLDIYRAPSNNGNKTPLITYTHGGGFTVGSKESIIRQGFFRDLLKSGISQASQNYRFFPQMKFPKNLEDIALSLQYLKSNTESLNIDGSQIGAIGSSAGGLTVGLLTFWKDSPTYAKFKKSVYNLPQILGALFYVTPAGFDREYIEESVGCDTSTWTKILKYYGLPLIKLPGKTYDWTTYYSDSLVAIDKEKSLFLTHINQSVGDENKPQLSFVYDGLITNAEPGSTEDDCLHSPNHFLMIENTLDAAEFSYEFYHGGGGGLEPNPSTVQGEIDFLKNLFDPALLIETIGSP